MGKVVAYSFFVFGVLIILGSIFTPIVFLFFKQNEYTQLVLRDYSIPIATLGSFLIIAGGFLVQNITLREQQKQLTLLNNESSLNHINNEIENCKNRIDSIFESEIAPEQLRNWFDTIEQGDLTGNKIETVNSIGCKVIIDKTRPQKVQTVLLFLANIDISKFTGVDDKLDYCKKQIPDFYLIENVHEQLKYLVAFLHRLEGLEQDPLIIKYHMSQYSHASKLLYRIGLIGDLQLTSIRIFSERDVKVPQKFKQLNMEDVRKIFEKDIT